MEKNFRRQALFYGVLLLAGVLSAYRSVGQDPLCACVSAWQKGGPAPVGCPPKDSSGRYDRSAGSYILFAGKEADAQLKIEGVLASLRACGTVGAAYEVQADYDQVQMNTVYSFLPVARPAAPGKFAGRPAKMQLSLKSRASSAAVLLKITGTSPVPGGEQAFSSATQNLLKEWSDALKEKKAFSAPKQGWAALYPAARYTGVDGAVGKYETGFVHRYEWRAEGGGGESLQQGIIQALGKIPAVMGNGSFYNDIAPGKTSLAGFRLLPPNPPIRIETSVDFAAQASVVQLSIIVPDGKTDR